MNLILKLISWIILKCMACKSTYFVVVAGAGAEIGGVAPFLMHLKLSVVCTVTVIPYTVTSIWAKLLRFLFPAITGVSCVGVTKTLWWNPTTAPLFVINIKYYAFIAVYTHIFFGFCSMFRSFFTLSLSRILSSSSFFFCPAWFDVLLYALSCFSISRLGLSKIRTIEKRTNNNVQWARISQISDFITLPM